MSPDLPDMRNHAPASRLTVSPDTDAVKLLTAMTSRHPAGASHHQKIVVVDDRVAFVGGLDFALGRRRCTHLPGIRRSGRSAGGGTPSG